MDKIVFPRLSTELLRDQYKHYKEGNVMDDERSEMAMFVVEYFDTARDGWFNSYINPLAEHTGISRRCVGFISLDAAKAELAAWREHRPDTNFRIAKHLPKPAAEVVSD